MCGCLGSFSGMALAALAFRIDIVLFQQQLFLYQHNFHNDKHMFTQFTCELQYTEELIICLRNKVTSNARTTQNTFITIINYNVSSHNR